MAVDLFTGLHGWAEGLIAAGWDVIGVDLADMSKEVGEPKPAHFWLIIQNVLTLHGSQFRNVDLIVSSSPCTEYSYMAMPWKRAKAKAAAIRADETGEALRKLNELFDAQFRVRSLRFEMHRVDAYPTRLPGAVQHNAWWDALALEHLLRGDGEAAKREPSSTANTDEASDIHTK